MTRRSIPTRSELRPLVALLLGLAFVGAAHAEGPAPAPSASARDEARALTESGLRHYQISDYAGAITEFKRAYLLDPQPPLLFNIAQSYRLSGDCESAKRFYSNYLRDNPAAQNRTSVESKLTEMQRCVDERAAAPATPPGPTPVPVTPVLTSPSSTSVAVVAAVEPPPRKQRSLAFKIGAVSTLGVGAILVGAGIGMSVRAADASQKVGDLFASGGAWDKSHQDLQSRGQSATTASIALYSIGGAALVAGAVLTGLAFPSTKRGRVNAFVSPAGAMAGWSCAY